MIAILSVIVLAASSCDDSQELQTTTTTQEPTTTTTQEPTTTTTQEPTTTTTQEPTTTTQPLIADRIAFTRDSYSEVWVMDADGGNQRPLTDLVSSSDAVWSPDGARIAFTSQSYNHYYSEIFVVDANGANLRQLTKDHRDYNPVWSPDGTQIAFFSDGALFVMDSDSTRIQRITGYENAYYGYENAYYDPDWSPDGTRLAFATSRHNEILVVDADGTNLRSLGDSDFGSFVWSPDGTRIAFNSRQSIFVTDADGTNLRQLTDNYDANAPAWSPDGSRIAFQSDLDSRSTDYEVFVITVDGSKQQQLTYTTLEQQNNNLKYPRLPVWSPDGTDIAFQSDGDKDGDLEVYVVDAAGGNLRQLTHNDYEDSSPIWSPDGAHIAFQSRVGGENKDWEIFVVDVGDGSILQLTDNYYNDSKPLWSPDSAYVAFTRSYPIQGFVMDSDGANQQFEYFSVLPLHHKLRFDTQRGGLSPDRTRITFQKDGEIFVTDADGSNHLQLPGRGGRPVWLPDPVWSPDGARIAFISHGGGRWDYEIDVVDADGANYQQLTNNNLDAYGPWCTSPNTRRDPDTYMALRCDAVSLSYWGEGPVWSPDGIRIAYTSPSDGYMEIFVVNADGGNPLQLTRNDHQDYPKGWQSQKIRLKWSPDSTRILFFQQ